MANNNLIEKQLSDYNLTSYIDSSNNSKNIPHFEYQIEKNDSENFELLNLYENFLTSEPSFKSEIILHAKVLEILNGSIITKCLIDKKEKVFQKRQFDIEPLRELKLKVNDILEIRIQTKVGERTFKYQKTSNLEIEKSFETKDYFSEFEGTKLFPSK